MRHQVEHIDFANNMASLIHGHSQPRVIAAVKEQLDRGTAFAVGTEIEIRYAEHLTSRNPGFEMLRFVNSGTEAVMASLKAARAFTGRSKIAKVEGAYHGLYDYAEVSQTADPTNWGSDHHPSSVPVAAGTPASVLDEVVVIPFNDTEHAIAILDEHRGELAGLVLDLMPHRVGLNPATPEFVAALREWTADDGALLIIDEVITFRSEYGGAQQWYGVHPDLTAMAKVIGGGFPAGAIAGRADIMDVMNPLNGHLKFPHSGTFSANPITMTAGLAAMELFDRSEVARLNALAQRAMAGINDAIRATGVTASVTGGGSMFRVHLKAKPPMNYREAFLTPEESAQLKILLDHLFNDGFIMINTCSAAMSTPMGEPEIDSLVASMERGFAKVAAA
jgi:glutamate-1-semialdehyde 2,1-aminomutase